MADADSINTVKFYYFLFIYIIFGVLLNVARAQAYRAAHSVPWVALSFDGWLGCNTEC
jgi:hypothetical protein